jgi:hypothetical protein
LGIVQRRDERIGAALGRLHAPDAVSDRRKIEEAYTELTAAQAEGNAPYARWAELEGQVQGS